MGSDLDLRGNVKVEALIDASGPSTSNVDAGTSTALDSEVKLMQCASNYEDTVFDVDTSADFAQKGEVDGEGVQVDVVNEGTNVGDIVKIEEPAIGQDCTESSSSFGGTLLGAENGSALSDGEVSSQYLDGSMPEYCIPGLYEGFTTRKKRLTDHWRRFISPLRWRATWLELQIKEFQSRALEYDKELEQYDERKQCLFENFAPEGFDSKSLALSGKIPRMDVMKRRKRKRIEETVNITSYMSNHNIFSYHANKKLSAEKGVTRDGDANQVITSDTHSLGVDDSVYLRDSGTSMEQILAKIVTVQSQIHQLKTRVEKVISENSGKFSSVNRLSSVMPGSAGNITDEEPASPPANEQLSSGKSLCTASQFAAEGDVKDLLIADPTVSDHGGITALPDMVESTNQIEDGVLINNLAAKEELLNFEKAGDEQENKAEGLLLERQKKAVSPAAAAVLETASPPVETPSPLEASNVKSRPLLKTYISSNKRKRRRRGAASRRKTKRLPG